MVINPNAGVDASQVEDLRNDAAKKAAGLADLPDTPDEDQPGEEPDEDQDAAK